MSFDTNPEYPANFQPFDETADTTYETLYEQHLEIQNLKKEMDIREETGLPSKKALTKFINDYDIHHPYGVIATYIDLKDFGQINRDIGHSAADRKIYEFAQGLSTVIREGDKIFNPHGDEFVLISMIKPQSDSDISPEQGLKKTLTRINNFSEVKFDFESTMFESSRHRSLKDAIDEADKKLMAKKQEKRNLSNKAD